MPHLKHLFPFPPPPPPPPPPPKKKKKKKKNIFFFRFGFFVSLSKKSFSLIPPPHLHLQYFFFRFGFFVKKIHSPPRFFRFLCQFGKKSYRSQKQIAAGQVVPGQPFYFFIAYLSKNHAFSKLSTEILFKYLFLKLLKTSDGDHF